jgi:hypothetical protein
MNLGIPMATALVFVATSTLAQGDAAPATPAIPLTVGETFTIESRVLGEVRRINVYRPPSYSDSAGSPRPVLYMPDGGLAEDFVHVAGLLEVSVGNATMRPFLLVGPRAPRLPADRVHPRTLYLASSSEPALARLTGRFAERLRKEDPPGVRWQYWPMPGETHGTIYHPAALDAVRRLFKREPDTR